ncbi:hypothetical protein F5X96DRAFT_642419 [Biscogniauxia mediterranea]|nr:hypothetical protein F5X96DRAFT_642419 [Biscogniauxia mediterranea]
MSFSILLIMRSLSRRKRSIVNTMNPLFMSRMYERMPRTNARCNDPLGSMIRSRVLIMLSISFTLPMMKFGFTKRSIAIPPAAIRKVRTPKVLIVADLEWGDFRGCEDYMDIHRRNRYHRVVNNTDEGRDFLAIILSLIMSACSHRSQTVTHFLARLALMLWRRQVLASQTTPS